MTFSLPTTPASYSWEATDEEVAARYGVEVGSIVRFDLNTSPAPPPLVERVLAAGRFEAPLSEYPPTDYRRLIEAAADRYHATPAELIVGAGADEILDIVGKTFIPPGARTVVSTPTYPMYRVITEQRGATVLTVPRLGDEAGWATDVPGVRSVAGDAAVVWLCSPNNPPATAEPDGAIESLLAGLAEDAAAAGRQPAIVVLDEAYAEFVGVSLAGLRERFTNLLTVRTVSKAYALAGLRIGFGVAAPAVISTMNPFRPPGSISTVSVSVVTDVLRDPTILDANLDRVETERARLGAALRDLGWAVGPSVTNFLLVDLGSAKRAAAAAEALLARGLVPRTFPDGHPLADHLRVTVRNPAENDRLIDAVRDFEATATGS